MMRFRVLDLDNCISNDEWRIQHIRREMMSSFLKFNNYHMLSAFDSLGNLDLLETHGPEPTQLVIITARPDAYELITLEWLRRKNINASMLFMRPYGDNRSSVLLKKDAIQSIIDKYGIESIEGCYDDRPDIIEMYRSLGLPAEVRFIHANTNYGPKGEGL